MKDCVDLAPVTGFLLGHQGKEELPIWPRLKGMQGLLELTKAGVGKSPGQAACFGSAF
jgi:hypothetical protein